jgi:DNA-binding transcriptional ArsR family regulator
LHKISPAQLRALTHPLRFRIVELLREGPSTASRLALAVGESTGSTSYHLRELAKLGLIEEDAGRGNGRERWWRRAAELLWIPTDAEDPETRAAQAGLRGVMLERDEQAAQGYLAHEPELDPEMRAAAFVGGWHAWATPEQIDELARRVFELVDEFRGPPEQRPDDARHVYITFRAVPWLE